MCQKCALGRSTEKSRSLDRKNGLCVCVYVGECRGGWDTMVWSSMKGVDSWEYKLRDVEIPPPQKKNVDARIETGWRYQNTGCSMRLVPGGLVRNGGPKWNVFVGSWEIKVACCPGGSAFKKVLRPNGAETEGFSSFIGEEGGVVTRWVESYWCMQCTCEGYGRDHPMGLLRYF